jgi:hypothetical protein
MAKTVGEAMRQYLDWLEPSATEVESKKSHRRTVEQALSSQFRRVNEVRVIGSHTRDTAINIWSDVDYLGMVSNEDVTWGGSRVNSGTTLDRTRRALEARFPQTNVWVDGPAVVVGFGGGATSVDVVPGVWAGTTTTAPHYPVYDIPDGEGGWLRTSPDRYAKYLRDEDARARGKLSGTIKLLKAWKYARLPSVPVLGFHLELLVASAGVCTGARSYQDCLYDSFRLLRDRGGAALNDPLSISTRVPATRTGAQRGALTEAARYAADKSLRAIEAEVASRIGEAFGYWNLVFNAGFPSR